MRYLRTERTHLKSFLTLLCLQRRYRVFLLWLRNNSYLYDDFIRKIPKSWKISNFWWKDIKLSKQKYSDTSSYRKPLTLSVFQQPVLVFILLLVLVKMEYELKFVYILCKYVLVQSFETIIYRLVLFVVVHLLH